MLTDPEYSVEESSPSERLNLNSDKWGPKEWFALDSIAIGYPKEADEKTMIKAKNHLESLDALLPCCKCRDHYGSYLKSHPLTDKDLSTRNGLINWILGLHNFVRSRQGKSLITIDGFFDYYESQYNSHSVPTILIVLLIIVIIIVCVFVYLFKWSRDSYNHTTGPPTNPLSYQ